MIIPALDLIDGTVVRLHQGDYGERGLSHPDVESDPIKRKYYRGAKIYHDDYGYGIIVNTQTNDEGEYAITVSFENSGIKRFLPKYQESASRWATTATALSSSKV